MIVAAEATRDRAWRVQSGQNPGGEREFGGAVWVISEAISEDFTNGGRRKRPESGLPGRQHLRFF